MGARPEAGAPGDSVAVVREEARVAGVALFALVAERGDNRRYSDLAITIVEILVMALGVLALLRRPGRIHGLSLQSVRRMPEVCNVPDEWGGIERQFVSLCDFCRIAAVFALISII